MKNRTGILISSLLFAVVLGTGLALAKTIQEKGTVSPKKNISPAEESIISSAATKVLRHIAKARGAVHSKELDQAKKVLSQAKKLIDIIKASLPTAKVKDHIWVAKKHLDYENTEEVMPDLIPIYAAGKYAAANKDLEQAGAYLKQVVQSADKKTRKEAQKLREDVGALKAKVEKGGKANGNGLTHLWARIKALSERETERISAYRQKLRARSKIKKDLVEAKMHLSYAEDYQLISGAVHTARVEIDMAGDYLKSATKHAG
ncbi:MAG: YfdX family protein, partial [Deltaproteobacteria bacterium]|nr:YfdX family protein [Deltaproteobacteria bacterium]